MNQELTLLILQTAKEENVSGVRGSESILFGRGGALDSIDLVRFLVALEAAIEERFAVPVILASEEAMSRKRSPYRSVASLAAHIEETLTEVQCRQDQ